MKLHRNSWVFLVLAIAGLVLRSACLEEPSLRSPEAANALQYESLRERGFYNYQPAGQHGPTLAYSTWLLQRVGGHADSGFSRTSRLRVVTVLFGLGLILLLPLVADGLGREAAGWAAVFTAVSPAMVFYSRSYMHEMLLVFFGFLALAAGWRYWRGRQTGWALLTGASLGLMEATKETFVLSWAAAVLALCLNQAWNRLLDASGSPVRAPRLALWPVAGGVAVWFFVVTLLFSSFFTQAAGPLDSLRGYPAWLNGTAGDAEHVHPWGYYLQRLLWNHSPLGPVWSEAMVFVLGLVGAAAGFRRRLLHGVSASFVRFLAFYTFLLTAFYSLFAYKTPWCLLSFWQGMILLGGVGAAVLLRSTRRRGLRRGLMVVLLIGAVHLAWQAWEASVPYGADGRNPYVERASRNR